MHCQVGLKGDFPTELVKCALSYKVFSGKEIFKKTKKQKKPWPKLVHSRVTLNENLKKLVDHFFSHLKTLHLSARDSN